MPDLATPEPISASLEFEVASVRIIASKRTDTVVEVLPSNGAEDVDVKAAQQTQVDCSGGRLVVKGPKKRSPFGKHGSIDVTIALPAGSDIQGASQLGDLICEGVLGATRLGTGLGDIRVEQAGAVNLKTEQGDIRLDSAAGDAQVLGAGRIEIREIAGGATVKNANGETTIDEITGDLEATASNGRITVGVAHAGVDARSANGGIRVGEVARGKVELRTTAGDVEVGIRQGTAARLDVNTKIGSVHNSLEASEGPESSDETVEVTVRTGVGGVVIRRS
ncbi:DUF4097 family beta strand repeat-containing protein [Streptomyces sp. NPDC000410]|uniref:DUF4097 family beta strand repeat-containing protein n=1 Tax=Streptomyces sp. NPDC000410 TaxID=3154254 RepID=UPI00332C133F